jgi:hypothetical protein
VPAADAPAATDVPAAVEPDAVEETTSTVMYQCPDNCQEGRAFFEAGKCKGCDKDLIEV